MIYGNKIPLSVTTTKKKDTPVEQVDIFSSVNVAYDSENVICDENKLPVYTVYSTGPC